MVPGLRVLSLDGGGTRVLSCIYILREIMDGVAPGHGGEVRPCEYFDMMGGSGPGGLACLLFAKFNLTVDEVIEYLENLSRRLDEVENLLATGKPYDIEQAAWDRCQQRYRPPVDRLEGLRQAILYHTWHDAIEANFGSWLDRLPFMSGDEFDYKTPLAVVGVGRAKGAVISSESPGLGGDRGTTDGRQYNVPIIHRTYDCRYARTTYTFYAIGLGTFAAPGVAKPGVIFQDFLATGRHTVHNPTRLLSEECNKLWPGLNIGTLISIGVGEFDPKSWDIGARPLSLRAATACSHILKENQKIAAEIRKYVLPLDKTLRSAYYRFDLPSPMPFFEYAARDKILSETREWIGSTGPANTCRLAGSALVSDTFPNLDGWKVALTCLASLIVEFNSFGYGQEAYELSDAVSNLMLYEEASEEVNLRRMISIAIDSERLAWIVRHGKPVPHSQETDVLTPELPTDGLLFNYIIALESGKLSSESKKLGKMNRLSDITAAAFYLLSKCRSGNLEVPKSNTFTNILQQLSPMVGLASKVDETLVERVKSLLSLASLAALCEACTVESLRGYKRLLYNGSVIRHLHDTVSTVNLEKISPRVLAPIADAIALSIQLNNWSVFRDTTIIKLLLKIVPNSAHYWSFVNLAVERVEMGAKASNIDHDSSEKSSHVLLVCEEVLSQASKLLKDQLLDVVVLSANRGFSTLLRKCLLNEKLEVFSGTTQPSSLALELIHQTTDENQETLMHIAARRSFHQVLMNVAECLGIEMAKEVLSRKNANGQTALQLACMRRAEWRFFELCWKMNANVNVQCNLGRTALHYCFPERNQLPDYFSKLQEMIEQHSLPTTVDQEPINNDSYGGEIRIDSRAYDFRRIIIDLLRHFALINSQDCDGLTPAHLAAREGWEDNLDMFFIKSGGKRGQIEKDCLSLRDKAGFTVLNYTRISKSDKGERLILEKMRARRLDIEQFPLPDQLRQSSTPKSEGTEPTQVAMYGKSEPSSNLSSSADMATLEPQVREFESLIRNPRRSFSETSSPARLREASSNSREYPRLSPIWRTTSPERSDIESVGRVIQRSRSRSVRSCSRNTARTRSAKSQSRSRSTRSKASIKDLAAPDDIVDELEVLGPDNVPAWSDLSSVDKLCKRCKSSLEPSFKQLEIPAKDSRSEDESRDIWSESNGPTIRQIRSAAHRGCHFCTLILTKLLDDRRNLRLGAGRGTGFNRKEQDKLYDNDRVFLRIRASRGKSRWLDGGIKIWCAKGDRHEGLLPDNVGFWSLESRRRANDSEEFAPGCMEYGHELASFVLRVAETTDKPSSMWHPESFGISLPQKIRAPITLVNGRYVMVEIEATMDPADPVSKHESFQGKWSPQKKVEVSDCAEDIAKYWLNDCLANHNCMDDTQDPKLPTRVVDIEGNGSLTAEPFLLESKGKRAKYATMSYRWGQCNLLKTTADTLSAHRHSIPVNQMPKTFRDMIQLTRALGLRYIWIDALCILQDSEEDCQRELDSMPEIYANSTVTIAVLGSLTADSGCSLNRNKLGMVPCRISSDIVIKTEAQNQYPLLKEGCLHDRAWCYQEVEISPRLLSCGGTELFWQCKKGERRESAPMDLLLEETTPDFDFDKDEFEITDWPLGKRLFDQGAIAYPAEAYRQWQRIINKYSKLSLTFPGDKLKALSAMAKRFSTFVTGGLDPKDYVCGLWKADLLKSLLWNSEGVWSKTRPGFRAPSWSWAAYDNEIDNKFMMHFNRPPENFCAEILDVSAEPVSQVNYFGPVKCGKLTIHGPVAGLPEEIYGSYTDEFAHFKETGQGLSVAQIRRSPDSEESRSTRRTPREERHRNMSEDGRDDHFYETIYERRSRSRSRRRSSSASSVVMRVRSRIGSRNRSRSGNRRTRTRNGSGATENLWFAERGLISWDIEGTPEMGNKVLRMTEGYGMLLAPVQKPGCPGIFQRMGIINVHSFDAKREAKLQAKFDAFHWKLGVVTII